MQSRDSFGRWALIFLLLMLSLLAWNTGSDSFRYSPIEGSPQFLGLEQRKELWRIQAEPEEVSFTESGITIRRTNQGMTRVRADLPLDWQPSTIDGKKFVRVSILMERLSESRYQRIAVDRPTFVLRQATIDKQQRKGIVLRSDGLRERHRIAGVIPMVDDVALLELFWQMKSSGQWRLSDLKIELLQYSSTYQWMAQLQIALAILILSIIAITTFRLLNAAQSVLLVGVVGITIAMTVVGLNRFEQLRGVFYDKLPPVILQNLALTDYELQKVGHIIAFFAITLIALWLRRRLKTTALQLVTIMLLLAFLTEAYQRHSMTRTSSLADIGIDAAGIALAVLCWWTFSLCSKTAGKLSAMAHGKIS